MRCFLNIIFIVLLNFSGLTHGYNILAVFTHPGKSHQWIFSPIVRTLSEKGHKLTVISHDSFKISNANYKEIVLSDPESVGHDVVDLSIWLKLPRWIVQSCNAYILVTEGLKACNQTLSNKDVQKLLHSDEKFDLIFSELFNNECVQSFVHKFQAPLVGISSSTMMPWHNDRFANPDNPSYIPNNHLWFSNKMGFFDRLTNLIGNFYYHMMYQLYFESNKALLEHHLGTKIPDLAAMTRNTSLILINSHFSFSFSRPLVPGVVEIGGIHMQSAEKKLPENIEKFINGSTHGVIYFSMGSMIKGHTFPQEKREEFLRAFARLPQRVLWKWENETMPGKPDNVMIQKWMPQFDILSHPNVKAFISHGGLLGTTEAIHCGVPMMIMPQFGDQHTNARAVEANGGGVILYLRDATEEKVYQN
ncbi:hypothetical protein WA026_009880 [Henosepilachna vigintioctopunctata]|uniref:UDP-glucuronosyltransferase n=1 Tax=Henosepilachna vigintioctopunctata TaxID=420089 RepID=A0AAW1TR67_9CUCU